MRMKNLVMMTAGLLAVSCALAGSLDPTNSPGPTMHTLEEIYQNTAILVAPKTLSSATAAVGAGYYTATNLTQVDADLVTGNIRSGASIFGVAGKAEVVDTTSGDAVAGNILSGKVAWVDGAAVTGTIATVTLSSATAAVSAGYYTATNLTQVDADLVTGNIRSGANIFGVAGKAEVVDTTSGDAVAGNILSGKVAWVDGAAVTGTIAAVTLSSATAAVSAGYYTATNLTQVDTDLTAGNIKGSKNIFGVTGSLVGGFVCTGSFSPLGRWCDNGDGTVTDTSNGLVWLKDAGWGGAKKWVDSSTWNDAQTRAGTLTNGTTGAGLTDGSQEGDWRLPSKAEFLALVNGTEGIQTTAMYKFTNVQSGAYWTSSTGAGASNSAWVVIMGLTVSLGNKTNASCYVWPVRGGQ